MTELQLDFIAAESITHVSNAIKNLDAKIRQFGHKVNLMKELSYADYVGIRLRFTSI
jgi:hypothetical protein